MESTPPPYRVRCINLCCKSMMVYGEDFESDPEYVAGQTEFWCVLTARGDGPDSAPATLEECTKPERSCFQAY